MQLSLNIWKRIFIVLRGLVASGSHKQIEMKVFFIAKKKKIES